MQAQLQDSLEVAIDKVDLESALEASATHLGGAEKENIFLAPLAGPTLLTGEIQHPLCTIRFFSASLLSIRS